MRILLALLFTLALHVSPVRAEEKEPDLATQAKAIKGPFTLIVHLQVKKGEEKTLTDLARPCIAATRKEPGCVAYELHQSKSDPTKFVFFEKWKNGEALVSHLAEEHTKKLVGSLGSVLDGAPKFSLYTAAAE
ncbi:MAG: putative quinol monooxygenase [Gemmataceae bacterium]